MKENMKYLIDEYHGFSTLTHPIIYLIKMNLVDLFN